MKYNEYKIRFEQLKKIFKNKRILIYGTGKFFKEIQTTCNLSELNIIGITDKKYSLNPSIKEDFGYKTIPIFEINKHEPDYILVCVEDHKTIEKYLKKALDFEIISFKKRPSFNIVEIIRKYFLSKNNKLVLVKLNGKIIKNPKIKNLNIKFHGKNNYVEIHEPIQIRKKCNISCKNNSQVIIKPFNNYIETTFVLDNNSELNIGEYTTIFRANIYQNWGKGTTVNIGRDCMLSHDIYIRTTDAHAIYNKQTNELINPNKNINIGDHVWIGAKTTILKGSTIPDNSVVGACSLINKAFEEENTVIAGIPAKIVKREIKWSRETP